MKLLILAVSFIAGVAHAAETEAKAPLATKVHCTVFTSDETANSGTFLFTKDVAVPEDNNDPKNTIEIFKSDTMSYTIGVIQHDEKIAPKSSLLEISIVNLKTGKATATSVAIWPRQESKGDLAGLSRLMVLSSEAEPGQDTQFICDSKVK